MIKVTFWEPFDQYRHGLISKNHLADLSITNIPVPLTLLDAPKTTQNGRIPEYDISNSSVKTGSYNEEIAVTTDCLLRPDGTTEIR